METILAGVAPVEFYDSDHNLYATATAQTDAGFEVSVSEDISRGGSSNARIGSYFFDSNLKLMLTNTTFKMEYLKMKLGSTITASADIWTLETVTTTVDNTITVADYTPVAIFSDSDTVFGYYKLANSTSDEWETITFSGQDATVSGLPSGSEVCVKYAYTNAGARKMTIASEIIPDIFYVEMKIPMFKAGTSKESYVSSSKVGELLVTVPQFQLDPNTNLALTSSGHATVSLEGNALINYGSGCDSDGYYATLKENIFGKDATANITSIMIEGSTDGFDLGVGDEETLKVYAKYSDGTAISLLDNSLLTFTSSAPAVATISVNGGLITGVSAGTSTMTAVLTDKTSVETNCEVTVS